MALSCLEKQLVGEVYNFPKENSSFETLGEKPPRAHLRSKLKLRIGSGAFLRDSPWVVYGHVRYVDFVPRDYVLSAVYSCLNRTVCCEVSGGLFTRGSGGRTLYETNDVLATTTR